MPDLTYPEFDRLLQQCREQTRAAVAEEIAQAMEAAGFEGFTTAALIARQHATT